MSLDIDLLGPQREVEEPCYACGQLHKTFERENFYSTNITHNLGKMAAAAHIYVHLWSPEELGIEFAWELVDPLEDALVDMKDRPEYYKKLDNPNGWGTYDHFVPFLEDLLEACKQYPHSRVTINK